MLIEVATQGEPSAENSAGGPPTPAAEPVAHESADFAEKNLQNFANSEPALTPIAQILATALAPAVSHTIGMISPQEAMIRRAERVAKYQRSQRGNTPAKIVNFVAFRDDVTKKFFCQMLVEVGRFTIFMREELPASKEVTGHWAWAATRPLIKQIHSKGGMVDDNMLVQAVKDLAQKARNKQETLR